MHTRARPPHHTVLGAAAAARADETDDNNRIETTVFDLAGPDRPGLLAEVTELLTRNGCNVRSAAVSRGA
jgi:glycine cleavage system regulatory protein